MFKLRAVLLQACLTDSAFGVLVVALASQIQKWLGIGMRVEPFFIRISGGFLIFVGVLYYFAYLHHERHLILVQATLALRFIFIVLLLCELLILLPRPFTIVHVSLLPPLLGEIYFATFQIYHLKKLGKTLIPLGG